MLIVPHCDFFALDNLPLRERNHRTDSWRAGGALHETRSHQWIGLLALAAAPAIAADIPVKAPLVAPVMAPPCTTGAASISAATSAAVGQRADYLNTANTTFFGDVAGAPAFSHNMSGFIGGGQIGYNFQSGAFVFGLEAMFDYSDIKGGVNPLRGGLPPLGQDDNFATRIESLFLGTARIGYAWNNVLLYAKGGYAGGEVKVTVVDNAGVNQGAAAGAAGAPAGPSAVAWSTDLHRTGPPRSSMTMSG